jgi:hypothetical protein
MTAYAVSKKLGIQASAIHRALKKREMAQGRICPCCNQIIRAGFQLNESVVKK